IVRDAEKLAMRMNHRGACACDNDTGDGAGVLTAIPHTYYAQELSIQVSGLGNNEYGHDMFHTEKGTNIQ
ncbi:hypothetical protein L9F63_008465, partial [Diploptera punctata]